MTAPTVERRQEPYVCVWFGTPEECQCCGGWTRAEGADGVVGPFPGDERFCSEECFVAMQDFRPAGLPRDDWCPACGYDRHDHADGCPTVKEAKGDG